MWKSSEVKASGWPGVRTSHALITAPNTCAATGPHEKTKASVLKTKHSSEDTLLAGEVHYSWDVVRANVTQFFSAHLL